MSSKHQKVSTILSEKELSSAAFKHNAYDFYKNTRGSRSVYPVSMGDLGEGWLITRYDDAVRILKDARMKKNYENVFTEEELENFSALGNEEPLSKHMLNLDPPDHGRLRSLVQKAFTPRMILQLEGRIQQIADSLLDEVEPNHSMNLVDDYAFPLPIIVISEMLGIPVEDRQKFRVWSQAIIDFSDTPESLEEYKHKIGEFAEYLEYLVRKKREEPAEDLVSSLIQAESEGTRLSIEELYSTIMLLIVAGHETTVNLITNMTFALLNHPDQLEKLRQNPDLIDSAIEEALRFYSPVELTTLRWAAEPFTLHGQEIKRKDVIIVSLASANRDDTVFPNADRFDIERKDNRHLAFGHGSHFCLGAPLARLEAKIAIQTLLRGFEHIEIKGEREQIKWKGNFLMRALEELPLCF
ncbi:Polyketide biosynthesis cytochrome P450 PksS [Bacillus paralicheniformis]|uniref:cytochrome P450 family protein n=1 Tax=Bacillus paralicheniformis TaxID=1648923 RepID=UPI0011A2B199|nr:cytochrome P450 [Bacillus paralicheniformis]KAA0834913.1 cytochrome P450 [Bacillus paralicheniformis]KAA0843842.1 cytochrome P450 [Bacillus paralicheniformis]MDU0413777.1 cytochrome P450 [Bacillus paralicheniformis]MED1064950.1 cytochrome P450 [Bacillus paralicheniformis]TWK85797.1 Polyketide biosynthesis cytochrome P450 PksS [Bacillus paralicheniformis]